VVTLAHQGGWDEVLMVLVPLVLVAVLLIVANKRAKQLVEAEGDDASGDPAS
jgi:hypothetical protein